MTNDMMQVQMRFEAHDGEIMSTKWNTMGKYFATAGADRKIKIWEVSRGGQLKNCTPDNLMVSLFRHQC